MSRRPRRQDEPSPAREQALRRHRDDYRGSDPAHRQRHYDRTQAPWAYLDYFRDLRSRLERTPVPVVDVPVEVGAFEGWLERHAALGRYYRS